MDLLAGLGTVLPGDRVASGEEELKRHGGVFTYHAPVRPDRRRCLSGEPR
jgi:hypothetical protein